MRMRNLQDANDKQEAMRYFSNEGFTRLFAAAQRKYESIGRIGGTVRLSRLREEEKEKLSGLLARSLKKQQSLTLRLQELENILRASRFEIDLLSLLNLLYGEKVKPKSVQQGEAESAWRAFIGQLRNGAVKEKTRLWLDGVAEGRGYGYRTFREIYDQIKLGQGENHLLAVIRGIEQLPVGEKQQLPIFAAKISGDPHFLDRDCPWGRLFYYGLLAYLKDPGEEEPFDDGKTSSYRIRKQYEQAGILLDALSSQVLVIDPNESSSYAITLDGIERFRERWEDSKTDRYDDHFSFINRTMAVKHIFVSENPSVCEALARRIGKTDRPVPAILCTSGQPSVAALQLLDFFADHGVMIHYSGDLDVKGLEIAISLEKRFGPNWRPWGMTANVARSALAKKGGMISGVSFSDHEQDTLQRFNCCWDTELIEALLNRGKKIYQEMFVDVLIEEYEMVVASD